MKRRFESGRLNKSESVQEDINPLDGVANLADIMLVFACGLMLALIINWNVDIGGTSGKTVAVEQGQDVTSQLQSDTGNGQNLSQNADYQKMGVVYKDPATGKMYLVTTGNEG